MKSPVKYVEIYQTMDLALLGLIKSSLIHRGIRYEIFDEQTLQSASIAAFGFSGARIMIHPADQANAMEVLMNVIPDTFKPGDENIEDSFVYQLEQKLSGFPILNKLPGVVIIIGSVVIIVAIISFFLLNT